MKKLAIIVQRYGNEVNGGAEFHARVLAEKLAQNYQINILTTTALDYTNGWKNHFPEGETSVNGIKVFRFKTIQNLVGKKFRKARRAVLKKKKYFKILRFFGLFDFFEKHFHITKFTPKDAEIWLSMQGPYCPDLVNFVEKNKDNYDAFIFFTYLYYPTVVAMPLVGEKSIFIPTAHDEPPLYSEVYKELFSIPKFIMYNTLSEKRLVENHFEKYTKKSDISGVGIDEYSLPENYLPEEKFRLQKPYFVYIGRIEGNKGCKELIHFFEKFSKKNPSVKLVMIGKDFMGVKSSENVILTGFVSEEDKYFLLKNSLGLIIPSKYESLSLVTLEAMISGKIPIVNGNCEVLKDHIEQSQAGFCFTNYQSFENALTQILSLNEEEKQKISTKAQNYVKEHYTWTKVLKKFDKAIDFIVEKD